MLQCVNDDVVGFDRIGDGRDGAVRRRDQFGTSGNNGWPIGGLNTVRGIAFSIRHSSTLRMTHTASFLPSGSLSFGRSTCA